MEIKNFKFIGNWLIVQGRCDYNIGPIILIHVSSSYCIDIKLKNAKHDKKNTNTKQGAFVCMTNFEQFLFSWNFHSYNKTPILPMN